MPLTGIFFAPFIIQILLQNLTGPLKSNFIIMKTIKLYSALILFFLLSQNLYSQPVIIQRVNMNANNINSIFQNTGIFNQNTALQNQPGFEWPIGSGNHAIFTTGINLAAYVNGQLRMASGSYRGEYGPGYVQNGQLVTNSSFKIYSIKAGDTSHNNPDYANWGLMVPYGAPYIDVNLNGSYETGIDRPGIKDAAQVIFVSLTDAWTSQHSSGEGFGGGTTPLMAQVALTAFCFNSPGLENAQFIMCHIINKSSSSWDSLHFSIFCDADLGDALDDYVGCDTNTILGYCYNADNVDTEYGSPPPAVGITLLRSMVNRNVSPFDSLDMTSFVRTNNSSSVPCENDPVGESLGAYNLMKGYKKDMSPWLNPLTIPPSATKFVYWGEPQFASGWTEYKGSVLNCGGTSGTVLQINPPGDRRFIMSSGAKDLKMQPNEKQTVIFAQHIALGSTNLNSVSRLKQQSNTIRNLFNTWVTINFNVGINNISSEIPERFKLNQNYPNPFNPSTKINFQIPKSDFVTLRVYDVTGKEISSLVNQQLSAGTYEVDFDASSLASGVYYYKLTSGKFSEVKKMMLVK